MGDWVARKRDEVAAQFRAAWGDRKPSFGDPEQIRLIKDVRAKYAAIEAADAEADGGTYRFRVEYTVPTSEAAIIVARSADEAEDILLEEEPDADIDDVQLLGEAPADQHGDVAYA